MGLEEESQPLYAFWTENEVVQPTRTPQGGCNSAANFQAKVEPCFRELRAHLLAWLDDFVLHTKSPDELLDVLQRFFQICKERNLVISLPKTTFFSKRIRWCGRIIDSDGVKMDPTNYEGIKMEAYPKQQWS